MSWESSLTWKRAKLRSGLLRQIRTFFYQRDVVEVETPILSKGTITDVHLDAFTCKFNYGSASDLTCAETLYLQTSPEFAMKRLIASGYGSIFQISKAFRHEAHGRHHNPEFSMLEWYRIGFTQIDLINEVSELLREILKCNQPEIVSYQETFMAITGIDPLVASKEQLLAYIAKNNKMSDWLANESSIDILLQFIFSELIEVQIGRQVPYFVYNFPLSQASLAKQCDSDPRVAERFECYFKGVELANGFNELTDANTQRARFEEDNRLRLARGMEVREIDERFMAALTHGLPECSGVALGVDRLMMLALGLDDIDQILSFSIETA